MPTNDKSLLVSHIQAHIRVHAPDVDPVTQGLMAKSLAEFVERAVSKYQAGAKEHGGRLVDRDLDAELRQELLDFYWYSEAKTWPAYLIPPAVTKPKPKLKQ